MSNKYFFLDTLLYHFLIFALLSFNSCQKNADQSCGDEFALNHEEGSTGIDNCQYSSESKSPDFIADLDDKVDETSGLASSYNHLITHNDRGGKNELYVIDLNGEVVSTITVNSAINFDWEDLAENDSLIFIGDFGNNNGERNIFSIYIVEKNQLDVSRPSSVVSALAPIQYTYPEQGVIAPGSQHNFDCEAMIYYNNALYVFTKHRLDDNTVLYKIPTSSGIHQAELIDSFHAGVRITGADISKDGETVVLIGYQKSGNCVLWKLNGFVDSGNFLSGQKYRYDLGPFAVMGQMEAVLFKADQKSLFITSEAVDGIPPRLYEFSFD